MKIYYYIDPDCKHTCCIAWPSGGIMHRKCLDCGAIV